MGMSSVSKGLLRVSPGSGAQIASAYGLRDSRAGTKQRKDPEGQVGYLLKVDTCGKARFRRGYLDPSSRFPVH